MHLHSHIYQFAVLFHCVGNPTMCGVGNPALLHNALIIHSLDNEKCGFS